MKTRSYLRIFIVIVTMIMIACSEPEIAPKTKVIQPLPTNEYYTSVTAWTPVGDGTFIGLVSSMLPKALSTADMFVVIHGERIPVQQSKASSLPDLIDGYLSASVQNNVLLLNFVGKTTTSRPPFPLDVVFIY